MILTTIGALPETVVLPPYRITDAGDFFVSEPISSEALKY
jgi:hypothetical protein